MKVLESRELEKGKRESDDCRFRELGYVSMGLFI